MYRKMSVVPRLRRPSEARGCAIYPAEVEISDKNRSLIDKRKHKSEASFIKKGHFDT